MEIKKCGNPLDEICDILLHKSSILLISHRSPDGDTLGSAFALKNILSSLGKQVQIICPDPIPKRLQIITGGIEDLALEKLPSDFVWDYVVSVDIASPNMFGNYMEKFADKVDMMIDHHIPRDIFAPVYHIEYSAGACAEIIYKLARCFEERGLYKLDLDTASKIYCGICTDTGCFKYSNASTQSHAITSELLKFDIDTASLNQVLLEMKSSRQVYAEHIIGSAIQYFNDGEIAVATCDLQTAQKYGFTDDDIDDIISLTRAVIGVEIGMSVKQKEQGIFRVSVRTSDKYDASILARHFGGGGHKKAAGCSVCAPNIDEAIKQLVNCINENKDEIFNLGE